MGITKVTLATIGHMPRDFDRKKVKKWQSSVFELADEIESYSLPCDSDGPEWEFSDSALEMVLPDKFDGNFLIGIVNVPLQHNWYSRRLSNNRVVFSFHEIRYFLMSENIPLENIVLRALYAYTLLFNKSGGRIPDYGEKGIEFTHDETRGCLFDFNGLKSDIVYSCHRPIICQECVERLRNKRISDETIEKCSEEIKKIQKDMFYRISDFIKHHPLRSLAISIFSAIILGACGSILGSMVYDYIK